MIDFILFSLGFLLGLLANQTNRVWLALPGTILHELMHYLTALILGAKPHPISLLPKKLDDNRYELGSVTFYPSWWNGGLIALAPFAVWPLLYLSGTTLSGFEFSLFSFCAGIIAFSGFPSTSDWIIAFKYPASVIPFIVAGYVWFWQQI